MTDKQSICMECKELESHYDFDMWEFDCTNCPEEHMHIWENGGEIDKFPIYKCKNFVLKKVK